MTTSKIIVDADHGKVDAAANKTAARYRNIANEASLINKQVDRIGNQFIGKAAGLSAILATMRAINEEAKKVSDTSVAASEKSGDRFLKAGGAIRSLGLDRGTNTTTDIFKQISGMVGARSSEELTDFLTNVAQQKGMTGDSAMRRLRLFSTGVVSDKEAMDPAANVARLEGDVSSRTNRLSYYEERELAARTVINRANNARSNREQVGGLGLRVGRAEQALAESQRDLASNVGITIGNTATLGAVNNARDSQSASGVEALLKEQIVIMKQTNAPKPTMTTTPESGP